MNPAMAAAWGAVALAFAGWMLPLEPSLLEEGYLIHFAQRMIDGEHLYRDLITYTGPLPFELLAALFRIFGEEIAVGRWAVAALHGWPRRRASTSRDARASAPSRTWPPPASRPRGA